MCIEICECVQESANVYSESVCNQIKILKSVFRFASVAY